MQQPLELSLFSGAGGGLLGTKLLGCRTVGYVEINPFKRKVLASRIAEGILDDAPIFDDIKYFCSLGYAAAYSGMVDLLTAGFPCQPHSVAGSEFALSDPRDLTWDTLQTIRIVRPRYALLENVRRIVSTGYHGRVLAGLAELGYDAVWGVFRAADVGAPHTRARWFCLAADATRLGQERDCLQQISWVKGLPWGTPFRSIEDVLRRPDILTPRLCRVGDGVADRLDRHEAVGDGQVPQVVCFAFHELMGRLRYLQAETSRQAQGT